MTVEPVAAAVVGGDGGGAVQLRLEGATDLADRPLQHAFGHEPARPDLIQELVLTDHAAGILDQVAQYLDGAGLERQDLLTAVEQIEVGRQTERAEGQGGGEVLHPALL